MKRTLAATIIVSSLAFGNVAFGASSADYQTYQRFIQNERPLSLFFAAVVACNKLRKAGQLSTTEQSNCDDLLQTYRMKMVGYTLNQYRQLSQSEKDSANSRASDMARRWMATNLSAIQATLRVYSDFNTEQLRQLVTSAIANMTR